MYIHTLFHFPTMAVTVKGVSPEVEAVILEGIKLECDIHVCVTCKDIGHTNKFYIAVNGETVDSIYGKEITLEDSIYFIFAIQSYVDRHEPPQAPIEYLDIPCGRLRGSQLKDILEDESFPKNMIDSMTHGDLCQCNRCYRGFWDACGTCGKPNEIETIGKLECYLCEACLDLAHERGLCAGCGRIPNEDLTCESEPFEYCPMVFEDIPHVIIEGCLRSEPVYCDSHTIEPPCEECIINYYAHYICKDCGSIADGRCAAMSGLLD